MKALRRIGLLALIISYLTINPCYGQSVAEQTWTKGVDYAAQGNFMEAKKEFENALKADPYFVPAKEALEVIEDVADKKIKNGTAIHFYRGVAYKVKRQWAHAITEFDNVLEINPKFAKAYRNREDAVEMWKEKRQSRINPPFTP